MSMRAIEFVENWVSNNIVPDGYQPGSENAVAIALARQCLESAKAAGIPESEIEDAFDDLPSFIAGEIKEANDRKHPRLAAGED